MLSKAGNIASHLKKKIKHQIPKLKGYSDKLLFLKKSIEADHCYSIVSWVT